MKTKTNLELAIVDHDPSTLPEHIWTILKWAGLLRRRVQMRSAHWQRLLAINPKYRPHAETWRDVGRRFLRRHSYCQIYVGGHHIALHAAGPCERNGQMPPCLARLAEVTPV